MSIHISRKELSRSESKIQRDLTIVPKPGIKDFIFEFDQKDIKVPFAYGREFIESPHIFDISLNIPDSFKGELRPQQQQIITKAVCSLTDTGSVIISTYTGSGKTIMAIYLACKLAKKTLILSNKTILLNQWQDTVNTFCPRMKSQLISPTKTIKNPEAMFYFMNPINISKIKQSFYEDIGTVIVDELHQIVTPKILKGFFRLTPDFLIGLSATPYRPDPYDKCIKFFFGNTYIGHKLQKAHNVFVVRTKYCPPIVYTPRGLDWNVVLEAQATNIKRNQLIVKILVDIFPQKIWLVLVKRVKHAELLHGLLIDRGIESEMLVGSKTEYNKNAKILIGTTSKIGVGFDNAAIDALLIATDVKEYFIQFLGRCMRRPNVKPIIVDIVDKFGPLERNFKERLKVYKNHGGTVKEVEFELT